MLAREMNVPLRPASLVMERRYLPNVQESRGATGPFIVIPALGVGLFQMLPQTREHSLDLLDRVTNPLVFRHFRCPFRRGTLKIELQQPPRSGAIMSAGPNFARNIG